MTRPPRAYLCTASATCIASSRVGTSTSAVGAAAILGAELRDTVQHRQRERGGLSRAGGRLREQIAPVEQQRNRLALDGRRLLVSERGDGRDERLVEPERGESG